jgi:putative membrane protein
MAFAVKYALEDSRRAITMFLFVGLIAGQIPSLLKITKKGERTTKSHAGWFITGLAILMTLLVLDIVSGNPDRGEMIDNSSTMVAVAFAILVGILFGLTTIVPGISGATVLLALGLFTWMNDFITGMEMIKFVPFALGFVITIFACAKVMSYVLKNHHHAIYYFILGLTIGSLILILVTTYMYDINGTLDLVYGCAACIIGIVVSVALSSIKFSPKSTAA